MSRGGKGIFGFCAAAIAAATVLESCARPLPEEGTPAAMLYRARCGTCHRAVSPTAMKAQTWQIILPRMEQRMRASGQPLSPQERATIEAYLQRNSG